MILINKQIKQFWYSFALFNVDYKFGMAIALLNIDYKIFNRLEHE